MSWPSNLRVEKYTPQKQLNVAVTVMSKGTAYSHPPGYEYVLRIFLV